MDRYISLEGGRNFRDLGGYETADGRCVRWRHLFRSGTTGRLTTADFAILNGLGIVSVCDLRTSDECRREPNRWQQQFAIDYWVNDHATAGGELSKILKGGTPTPDEAHRALTTLYGELPYEHVEGYRHIFQSLAKGRTPFLFNCSAGKDRAGVAAALVLRALGVHREQVVEDYLLSSRYISTEILRAERNASDSPFAALIGLSQETLTVLCGTSPDYLSAMFRAIDDHGDGFEGYLHNVLNITEHELGALRAQLLE